MSRTKSLRSRLGDTILTLLAVGGSICIILVILAFTMNVSIMMFRTGSMEPTIPAGSIALVREIPATEMSEGDVVTVDRGEKLLPVTHRVTEISEVDKATGAVTFTMRGDANDTDDAEPYVADTVQRAFFSIPGVAPVIRYFQNPLVLGGLTIGATALVIWAFWPRERQPTGRKRRGAHAAHAYAMPILIALSAPLLLSENITTQEIHGDYLRLRSSGDPQQMTNMSPGQSATWAVDVWAEAPEPGRVDLELMATGSLTEHQALAAEVTICQPHPTEVTGCAPGGETNQQLIDTTETTRENEPYSVGTMTSDQTSRVLVTATLSDSPPASAQQATAAFYLVATGHGEELSITTDPETPASAGSAEGDRSDLARSGFSALWLLGAALLLILVGTLIARARSQKERFGRKDMP